MGKGLSRESDQRGRTRGRKPPLPDAPRSPRDRQAPPAAAPIIPKDKSGPLAAAPEPQKGKCGDSAMDCFRVYAEFKAILSSQSRHPMQPPSNTSQAVLSRDIPPHTVEKCRKMQLYYRCGIPKLKQKSHEIDLSSTNFWLSAHGTIYAAMRIFYSASGVVDIGFLHAGPLNCQNRKTAWTKLADIRF